MRLFPSGRFLFLNLFLVLALSAQTMQAQSSKHDWDVVQKIKPGTKLRIKTKTGQKMKGRAAAITADSITMTLRKPTGKDVVLKREEIAEIRQKSGAQTAGYAALFAGLGFAGGYGIGYGIGEAKDARFRPEYATAAVGVAAGAVIGAIIGSRGQVIYKAP